MAFRKFGTFRTPNGWLTTTGDGEILQRGTKRGEETGTGADWLQFEVTVNNSNQLRIKRGTVITGIGSAINMPPTVCNRQFSIRNVFASTLNSVLGGSSLGLAEPYVNNNGYVTLPSSPVEGAQSGHVGIWIARNVFNLNAYARLSEGYPFLIVDNQAGTLELATRPWGTNGCDMVEWYTIQDTYEFDPPTLGGTPTPAYAIMAQSSILKNYNCQRFRIADVKYESGAWKVYQYWQGTVTLPHPVVYRGITAGSNAHHYDYPASINTSVPPWRLTKEKNTEQQGWENAMIANDRGHTYPTTYETIP